MNMFKRFFGKKPEMVVDTEATRRAHAAFQGSTKPCEKMTGASAPAAESAPVEAGPNPMEKIWIDIIGLEKGVFQTISTEQIESGANSTGYFDGLARKEFWKTNGLDTDGVYMGRDSHGRTVVLVGRGKTKGFQVLFNRYKGDNRVLISQTSTSAGQVREEVGISLLLDLYDRMKPSEQEEQAAA